MYVFLDDLLSQNISQTTFRVTLNNEMRYWREVTNVLKSTYELSYYIHQLMTRIELNGVKIRKQKAQSTTSYDYNEMV